MHFPIHLRYWAFILCRTGNKENARKLLLAVLEKDIQNGTALLLYLDTFDSKETRAQGLELWIRKQNLVKTVS